MRKSCLIEEIYFSPSRHSRIELLLHLVMHPSSATSPAITQAASENKFTNRDCWTADHVEIV